MAIVLSVSPPPALVTMLKPTETPLGLSPKAPLSLISLWLQKCVFDLSRFVITTSRFFFEREVAGPRLSGQSHRGRKAALSPFSSYSSISDPPETLRSKLHIAATSYWSTLLLWDLSAVPSAQLCSDSTEISNHVSSSLSAPLGLFGELWLQACLSTETKLPSSSAKQGKFSLIH